MNKNQSIPKGIYNPSSDDEKSLALIRIDLALLRYEVLIQKGKRWAKNPKRRIGNPPKTE
jgi:hypothetical protein